MTVEFDDGEVFQWSKVTTTIYNLIIGKVYCDHHGIMHISVMIWLGRLDWVFWWRRLSKEEFLISFRQCLYI
ncbi:hypothetical protein CsatB_023897 [Cannabis sativa]